MKKYFFLSSILIIILFSGNILEDKITWTVLEEGLELAKISSPVKSSIGNSEITVLRINPEKFNFVMKNASAPKGQAKNIDEWCKENNLIGAVNAGMFKLEDPYNVGTGYTVNFKHVNNSVLRKDYKLVLAFNPKDTTVPKMQLIDITLQNWAELKTKYNTFSQGLRVVTSGRINTWQQQSKKWSMVLWGTDSKGNALWIFTRSPYSVHDFAYILLSLDLKIDRIMYLEGGPEGSMYLNHPKASLQLMGSYETGFNENDNNKVFWKLPNIIGIQRK